MHPYMRPAAQPAAAPQETTRRTEVRYRRSRRANKYLLPVGEVMDVLRILRRAHTHPLYPAIYKRMVAGMSPDTLCAAEIDITL